MVQINDVAVGLIVDSVPEVPDIPASQIDSPPNIRKNSEKRYIQGLGKVGDSVKIILDLNNFLFAKELQVIFESVKN